MLIIGDTISTSTIETLDFHIYRILKRTYLNELHAYYGLVLPIGIFYERTWRKHLKDRARPLIIVSTIQNYLIICIYRE